MIRCTLQVNILKIQIWRVVGIRPFWLLSVHRSREHNSKIFNSNLTQTEEHSTSDRCLQKKRIEIYCYRGNNPSYSVPLIWSYHCLRDSHRKCHINLSRTWVLDVCLTLTHQTWHVGGGVCLGNSYATLQASVRMSAESHLVHSQTNWPQVQSSGDTTSLQYKLSCHQLDL